MNNNFPDGQQNYNENKYNPNSLGAAPKKAYFENNPPKMPKAKKSGNGLKMFFKSPKAIAIISSVLVISIIGGTAAFVVRNKNKQNSGKPSSSVSETEKGYIPEIKYSGIVHNGDIFTVENTDYCIGDDGKIYAVTESEKTPLSEQNDVFSFTIINNTIYYVVINNKKTSYDDLGNPSTKTICSCWQMNIDGTKPQEIMTSIKNLTSIVYATDKNIFFTGFLDEEEIIIDPFWCDMLYKYETETKQTTNISAQEIKGWSANYSYADGYIVYNGIHTDPSNTLVFRYDVLNDTTQKLDFQVGDVYNFSDTSVLMTKSNTQNFNGNITENCALIEYFPKDGTKKIIAESDNVMDFWFCKDGFKPDERYIVNYHNGSEETNNPADYYCYNKNSGLKKLNIKYDPIEILSVENGIYSVYRYYDDDMNKIVFYSDDGTEKEIYKTKNTIEAVGKNILIEGIEGETYYDITYKIVDIPVSA